MYQLENIQYFYGLLILPVLILLFIIMVMWQKRTRKNYADSDLLKKLSPDASAGKRLTKLILMLLVFASLTIAMVNPKMGTKLETVTRKGVDVVFAIDVSKSMLAEDIAPSRIEKAKQLLSRTLDELNNDRVGIVVYAGNAYPQLPITTDYSAARTFLKTISTDDIPTQGTAIADAIDLSMEYFDNEDQKNRVLFIISDGEDHESGTESAAKSAAENGVQIYTIGVGNKKGGPIPIKRRGREEYKKDREGNVVVTRLDEKNLKKIAEASDGEYINGASTVRVVDFVKETLDGMEKTEFDSKQFSDYKDQFQWFLGTALLFLFLDSLALERRTAWLKKLNLFGNNNE